MDVTIATLCDAATDYGGKLNLLGAFDTILSARFPAVQAQCALALRIVFNQAEQGRQVIQLRFVNEDGQPIMPGIGAQLDVQMPAQASYLSRNFIVNLQNLRFTAPGQYAVNVFAGDEEIATIPLLVRQLDAPQDPSPSE